MKTLPDLSGGMWCNLPGSPSVPGVGLVLGRRFTEPTSGRSCHRAGFQLARNHLLSLTRQFVSQRTPHPPPVRAWSYSFAVRSGTLCEPLADTHAGGTVTMKGLLILVLLHIYNMICDSKQNYMLLNYNLRDLDLCYLNQYRIPGNMIHWPNVGSMLGHRLRRWPSIGPTLGQCIVFAGILSVIKGETTRCNLFCRIQSVTAHIVCGEAIVIAFFLFLSKWN